MQQIRESLDWLYVDWGSLDWKQFLHINDFKWKVGETPFSHLQVPVVLSFSYLLSLYLLQNYMKDRKPLTLKGFTLVHNAFLSLLSLSMFLGASYGVFLKLQTQGFWAGLVCEQDADPMKGPLFYWSYIFYLSKFYEFVDSFLLVLKKKELIFLHMWHHLIMPFVCWAGLEGKWAMALWTSTFWNSFVHVLMYYYYAVATIGVHPWWKKHLTALQIYQFVSGVVYTSIYFYYYFQTITLSWNSWIPSLSYTQGCTGDLWAISFMFSVNCSFLVLFSQFFANSYMRKPNTSGSRAKKDD